MAKKRKKKQPEPIPLDRQAWNFKEVELIGWDYPGELEGKTFDNIGELVDRFKLQYVAHPRDVGVSEYATLPYLREREMQDGRIAFDRISRKSRIFNWSIRDLAYGCGKCNQIVVGPPEIVITQEGEAYKVDFCCTKCQGHIYQQTFEEPKEEPKPENEQPQNTKPDQ